MHGVFYENCGIYAKIHPSGGFRKIQKIHSYRKPAVRKPLSIRFSAFTVWRQPVQTAEIRSGRKKCLTKSNLYRIINIVSYYADRQRHMPASCAGHMPVLSVILERESITKLPKNVPAEEASALKEHGFRVAYVVQRPPGAAVALSRASVCLMTACKGSIQTSRKFAPAAQKSS